MKFPRNARMLKGHLDFAPFASVFFCLLIFVQISRLVYTPGVLINLPPASRFAVLPHGSVVQVSLDASGGVYFDNHYATDADLKRYLLQTVRDAPPPVWLEIFADTNSLSGRKMQLLELAQQVGITNLLEARAPGIFESRGK